MSSSYLPGPDSWSSHVDAADALFFPEDDTSLSADTRASIGNGYFATLCPSTTLFIGGVFNGEAGSKHDRTISHRAVIPSPLAVEIVGETALSAALDFRNGAYFRYTNHTVSRIYAHRTRRNLLVLDIEAAEANSGSPNFEFAIKSLMSATSKDLEHVTVGTMMVSGVAVTTFVGTTKVSENPASPLGALVTVALVFSEPAPGADAAVALNATSPRATFLAGAATSLDGADPLALASAAWEAANAAGSEPLWEEHAAGWAAAWASGLEVSLARRDVAVAVNSSLYYLLSSARDDYPHSLSPGGLASNAYNGHSFWDCETWM